MIFYKSKHPELTLSFTLGRQAYTVAPGEVVAVDDCWADRIVSRGLLLEPVDPPTEVVEVAPTEPPVETTPTPVATVDEEPAPVREYKPRKKKWK